MRGYATLFILALTLVGCGTSGKHGNLYFEDDLQNGDMSLPVLAGTTYTIFWDEQSSYTPSGLTYTDSSNDAVLSVVESDLNERQAMVEAVGPGTAEFQVWGNQGIADAIDVSVGTLESIALEDKIGMRIAETGTFAILGDSSHRFDVRPLQSGGGRLRSNQALELVSSDPGLEISLDGLAITIRVQARGIYSFVLGLEGLPHTQAFTCLGVGTDEVASLSLHASPQTPSPYYTLTAHAQMTDGTQVHGVPFTWSAGGDAAVFPSEESSALASATLPDANSKGSVSVAFATLTSSIAFPLPAPESAPGCSLAVPGGRPRHVPGLVALSLGVVALFRRRRHEILSQCALLGSM